MSARTAEPLPECLLCETPTQREAHERNGGLCTPCLTSAVQLKTRRSLR